MTDSALPKGWTICVSRSKRKIYYYHQETNTVQWSRPGDEENCKNDKIVKKTSNKRQRPNSDSQSIELLIRTSLKAGLSEIQNVFIPWNHQISAINAIMKHLQSENTNNRFLIQHSTGSGKTATMSGLAHLLLLIADKQGERFHTVFLITDRIALDTQNRLALTKYLMRNGFFDVFYADNSDSLGQLMQKMEQSESAEMRQRVIISTVHKLQTLFSNKVKIAQYFHLAEKVTMNKFSRIAFITDEAHRTHTSDTRQSLEKLVQSAEGTDASIIFIGFSSTPNVKTLSLFGTIASDSSSHPFHCYSIAQAIKDQIIMNMLQHYSLYQIQMNNFHSRADPSLESVHRQALDQVSESIHFSKVKSLLIAKSFTEAQARYPKAKAMVVARSRKDVITYHQLLQQYSSVTKCNWRIYAAFSGTFELNSESIFVTEKSINGPETLDTASVIIVCDKLETGYNNPNLTSLFLDRPIRNSARMVQVISRINRKAQGKQSVNIIDFSNHPARIRLAFAHYWTSFSIENTSHTLKLQLKSAVCVVADLLPDLLLSKEDHMEHILGKILKLERDPFHHIRNAMDEIVTSYVQLKSQEDSIMSLWLSEADFCRMEKLHALLEGFLRENSAKECNKYEMNEECSSKIDGIVNVFSGAIYPESLLALARIKDVNDLIRFGENALQRWDRMEAIDFIVVARSLVGNGTGDVNTKTKLLDLLNSLRVKHQSSF